jgi:formate-dependent phosphoribosylglycinamide formyltransferase (GAR transformylase)
MGGVPLSAKPRLLVLGAGTAQLGLLEAARERDLCVIAVDRDAGAPGFAFADRRALLPSDDEPAIHRLAEAECIDGVVAAGADATVGIAARVAQRLSLPHPLAPASATLATSRVRQRERFAEAGVPHVPWRLATNAHLDVRVPCVVKAPDRGGRPLAVVRRREELAPALRAAIAASRSGTALVEELVEGPEVTVHGFSVDGGFHELLPSELGELAASAAAALGIANGPTQTEIRVTPDGPLVSELVPSHDGTVTADLDRLVLAAALGEPIDTTDLLRFGAAHVPTAPAAEAA